MPSLSKSVHRQEGKAIAIILGSIITAGVIGIAAISKFSANNESKARAQVAEGLATIMPAKANIATYIISHTDVPKSIGDIQFTPSLPPHVVSVGLLPSGAVFAAFGPEASPALTGKQIAYIPSIGKNNYVEWSCGSTDIPQDLLPADCRTTSVPQNLPQQLAKKREDAKLAAEAEIMRKLVNVSNQIQEAYPELNPTDQRYSQHLADAVNEKARVLFSLGGKGPDGALKQAAYEVMRDYEDEKGRIRTKAKLTQLEADQRAYQIRMENERRRTIAMQQQAEANRIARRQVATGQRFDASGRQEQCNSLIASTHGPAQIDALAQICTANLPQGIFDDCASQILGTTGPPQAYAIATMCTGRASGGRSTSSTPPPSAPVGAVTTNPQSLFDTRSGTHMPSIGGGNFIDPRSGTVMQGVAGGVVNTQTGKFSPTH